MASSTEYLLYVLDCLQKVSGISHKKMMGEYLLYKDGVLFGGVYDDRFLVKDTQSASGLGLAKALPYDGTKPMLLVETEDMDAVANIVNLVCDDLSKKK